MHSHLICGKDIVVNTVTDHYAFLGETSASVQGDLKNPRIRFGNTFLRRGHNKVYVLQNTMPGKTLRRAGKLIGNDADLMFFT